MIESWYFAFGANMSTRIFAGRRAMEPSYWEPAVLADYRLSFSEPGVIPGVEPAFANIEAAPGRKVFGVLYRMPERHLARLDRAESENYRRRTLQVVGAETGPVQALAYQSRRVVCGALPSRRYLGLLLEGAAEHRLPMEYQAWLESHPHAYIPAVSELMNRVLPVYAKLREYGVRHEVLTARMRRLVNLML